MHQPTGHSCDKGLPYFICQVFESLPLWLTALHHIGLLSPERCFLMYVSCFPRCPVGSWLPSMIHPPHGIHPRNKHSATCGPCPSRPFIGSEPGTNINTWNVLGAFPHRPCTGSSHNGTSARRPCTAGRVGGGRNHLECDHHLCGEGSPMVLGAAWMRKEGRTRRRSHAGWRVVTRLREEDIPTRFGR